MWLSDVSVKRPVFASVISLMLLAFGLLMFRELPLREYPDITQPIVSVSTNYPGASAEIVETQITQIVEDAVSGVEGIKSVSSSSRDSRSSVSIEFELDVDIDRAANDVRDRVARIVNRLPEDVSGLPEVSKRETDASPLIYLIVSSPNMSPVELRDYVDRYLVDQFSVLPGVSSVSAGGSGRPSIRVWLDRAALAARNLTVPDVEAALRRENVELPAGRIDSIDREFTVRIARQYTSAEDFANLVLGQGDDGHLIRLAEVATVTNDSSDLRQVFLTNGQNTVSMGVVKQSTANTVEVLDAVNRTIENLAGNLPDGMRIDKNLDPSVFIKSAINGVYTTIFATTLLVGLVIFLFLGSLRATVIPMVTIPVCLIASFIVLGAFGYTVNLITLLALVLSIGLVVDDSIVVLENIHRRIERGENPLLAAYRGSRQVGFAVIATTAVLVAVFTPIIFLHDAIGLIFSELAITISAAVIFSSVLALSLAPMLSSKLLRGHGQENRMTIVVDRLFQSVAAAYEAALARSLRHAWVALPMIGILVLVIYAAWRSLPQEYAPEEDPRFVYAMLSAPEGTSYASMESRIPELQAVIEPLREEGLIEKYVIRLPGWGSTTANSGVLLFDLPKWDDSDATTREVLNRINAGLQGLPDLRAFGFIRSGISGSGGSPINFVLQGPTYEELAAWRDLVIRRAEESGLFGRLDSDLKETQPQVFVQIDKDRASDLGISVQDIGRTLQIMMSERESGTYVVNGEEYPIIVQAREDQRASPDDMGNIFVRASRSGELVPLSSVISTENGVGSGSLNRYNRLRAVTISGDLAPGVTIGEGLEFLVDVVRSELPDTAGIDYKGQSLEYRDSSGGILFTVFIALVALYLVMAAQFESFIHPLVIMFTVPMSFAGAMVGLELTGQSMNIYSQIGMVMLIGIASKNGILIVEFINQLRDQGVEFVEAIVEAARIRLRPVIMTTISTIMGSIPLILATGPGSESRLVLGVVILFGVSVASLMTLFLVPMFYKLLARNTQSPKHVERELELMTGGNTAVV